MSQLHQQRCCQIRSCLSSAELDTVEKRMEWYASWIRDDRKGLMEEEQYQLLTPFTQRCQIHPEGYAPEVSIAHPIADRLGGAVNATGTPSSGSELWLRLAIAHSPSITSKWWPVP